MPLPTHNFASNEITVRYGEHYPSQAVNTKFLGVPPGIYLGFTPEVTSGSLILTLKTNTSYGVSFARTRSQTSETDVDVVIDEDVTLDFTGHDFTLNPTVYVKLRAESALGQPTTAEIFTAATPPPGLDEQLICVVTKPAADLVATASEPANRDTPYAYTTAPYGYGFMADSAVEQLLAAVAMVDEVAAARVDMEGINHPWAPPGQLGLDERINTDLAPDKIADRLGLHYRVLRGEDYTAVGAQDTFAVSGSFAPAGRTRPPIISIPADGSEAQSGAITDSDLDGRNTCFVTLASTGERIVDSERLVVYGRLYNIGAVLTGTVTFVASLPAVTGVGTLFLTEVAVGDILVGPDGTNYIVTVVVDDFNIITSSAIGVGGVTAAAVRLRFELRLVKNSGGVEVPHAVAGGTTIRFFFGAFLRLNIAAHDATAMMFAGGEEPPLADSAVGVKGKVLMHPGISGALAGAVFSVKDAGSPVGTGVPTYSLDFSGAAAGAPNVANISAAGPTGPPGPGGGSPGPTGGPGPTGFGYDSYSTPFSASSTFTPPPGGWPSSTVLSHSVIYPSAPKYLHGGMSLWQVDAIVADFSDHGELTLVNAVGSTGTVQLTTPNTGVFPPPAIGTFQLYLNAAG